MLKKSFEIVAPRGVGEDFICNAEEQADYDYFKGVIHAAAPIAIGIFSISIALVYFLCVFLLYSTVFRARAQGFFGSLALICLFCLLCVAGASS